MATIRQYSYGAWQAIVRRQGIKPVSKAFNTRSDAERWARQVENEIDRAVYIDRRPSERITIGELIDRYLSEVVRQKKSAHTLSRCLTFLRPHFSHYTLATLQPKDVAAYRDSRIASGKAGATVVKELNMLSRVIDVASEWGYYAPSNPVKAVRRPSVARGRERRLTTQEDTALLQRCEKSRAPMLGAIVRMALETGMRMGELLSLEWTAVDLSRCVARLHDSKNGEARDVPLSPRAIAVLKGLPRHIANSRVFWAWNRADSLENAWRRAVAKAGIKDLHFHDLRHEAVSRLFERGLNIVEVSAVSGHKTLQMLKRYTHLKAEELVRKLG